MHMKTTGYKKPKLLVLLTFFIGVGVMASGLVQASEALNIVSAQQRVVKHAGASQGLQSERKFDTASMPQRWKPWFTVGEDGQGLNLARPFGVRGPTLWLSKSMPDDVKRCLRAGGDRQIGTFGAERSDAYLFLEKRW